MDDPSIHYVNLKSKIHDRFALKGQPIEMTAQGRSAVVLLKGGIVERISASGHIQRIYSVRHGHLYGVAASESNSLWILGAGGALLITDDGKEKRYPCQECSLYEGASATDGSLWASDALRGVVYHIQRNGEMTKIAVGDRISPPGQVVATGDGSIWVAVGENKIKVISAGESLP